MLRLKTPSWGLRCVAGLFYVAAWSSQVGGQATQATGVTVFEGARLIVGDGRAPIEDAAFIVENHYFTQVGRRDQLRIPAGAVRIDLTGKTVMPAIINTHAHLARTREELVDQLQRLAYYGIAAAVSLGSDQGALPFEMRDNPIPGAALFRTAGRGIVTPQPGRSDIPYWITTEAEARKAVRELAAKKVDLVKIWVDDRNKTLEKLTPALYGAIIDEANKHNLRVAAHIWELEDAKGLLRAGIHVFAHGVRDRYVDVEFLTLLKERPHVFYVPTLPQRDDGVVVEDLTWLTDGVAPDALKNMQEAAANRQQDQRERFEVQWGNLASVNAAGVQIGLGTDGSAAWTAHTQMADMVNAGMTPAQVIVAATSTAADILRFPDHGTVAPGKSASFIVLDANPLDDIINTRRIAAVYLRGTEVDRAALRAKWQAQWSSQ